MADPYPLLKADIFYAKLRTPTGFEVRIHNTTTGEDLTATPLMVVVLELCTGTSTVTDIIAQLYRRPGSPSPELIQSITTLLTQLQEEGIITLSETPLRAEKPREIRLEYPLKRAQIEITNRCNLSCLHCFNNAGDPCPNELTTEEVLSLIDTLSSMGAFHLTLTGGEPLMHPDLLEIIAHARKAPMSVDIFTNGTLITEDAVEEFKRFKIRRFNVSVDSVDESIHDRLRGKKGALRKTLHAMDLLKEAGFSIKPVISLSQLNKDKIIDLLRYCKEKEFRNVEMIPVRYSGRGIGGLAVSAEEYYYVLLERFSYLKEEFPEGLSVIREKPSGVCGIARTTIGIASDGPVLPCPGCEKEMGVGNVRDADLETLWEEHEELRAVRDTTVRNDGACVYCSYVRFCTGCIAGAFSAERHLRCCDPFLCVANKAYDEMIGF